jgi:hypothetical protein
MGFLTTRRAAARSGAASFERDLDLHGECVEPPGVNMKTAVRILSGLSICAAFMGCATESRVVSMGNGNYAITRKATTGFSRDTDGLTAQAKEDALKFCQARGKQLKVVDVVTDKPLFSTGYASAQVVFRAVDAGDPGLTSEPASAAVSETPASAEASDKPAAGSLFTELTKLDELRKKGILSEEEFQAEKKKILSRSK